MNKIIREGWNIRRLVNITPPKNNSCASWSRLKAYFNGLP
jgi:hypothetical protein